MADLDVLRNLPEFEFRGIVLPLISRSVQFSHQNATHKFAFRDGELLDGLGRTNNRFSYVIPFRQGIAKGPYSNLYTETFPKFLEAFRDRTEGPLLDPVLGEFQVRPGQLSVNTDIQRRDGEDVSVDFIHSPVLDEPEIQNNLMGISGVSSEDGALEEALGPIETGLSLDELLSNISNLKAQWSNFGNQFTAQLSKVSRKLKEFEGTVTNPKNWPLIQESRTVRMAVEDLKENVAVPARETITITTKGPKTIAALSSMTGMGTEELLLLNPSLASGGAMVPAGTKIRYFKNR